MSTTSIDCKLNRKKFKTKVYDSRLSLAVFIQILSKKKLYSQHNQSNVNANYIYVWYKTIYSGVK